MDSSRNEKDAKSEGERMENPSSEQEQKMNEVITYCIGFTLPLKPPLLKHLYKRIKYLSDCGSVYLPNLATLGVFKVIRYFAASKERELRTTALKLYRYICTTEASFRVLKMSHVEHFIIRSFEAEGKSEERIEACKLIWKWLEIASKDFPKAICNSLVALSEVENDEFKDFGIESLRFLSSSNLPIVAWSGGLKILTNAILDIKCSQELGENIIFTLGYLLNEPNTRMYLKNGKEISRILSVFTEHESGLKENELEAVIKLSRKVLVLLSRCWAGLIYLTSNGLREIITNLKHPIKPIIKEGILETIFDMVNIPVESAVKSYNLLNNYLAMLLKALLHCDLYPALTCLAIDKNTRIAQRARKLLKIVTKAASDLLPESPQLSLNLVSGSAGKTAELVADIASSARLFQESIDKNLLKLACDFISYDISGSVNSANVVISGIYKQHFINTIDEQQYLVLLAKTQVTKEVLKWDWETIYDIISGPMTLPFRFSHPQSQKFLKNIVGYFMPSKGLFSILPWKHENFLKARVGSKLISLLLSQEEGITLLSTTYSESFFVVRKSYMGEFNDAIEEEIKYEETKVQSTSRIFTPERVKCCMAREYFKWIGIFLSSRLGKKLLKTYIIDSKLVKLANIEHLGPLLLTVLDFKDQSAQQFLTLLLQSKSKVVRLKAMEYLRVLFRAGSFDLSWAIWCLNNHLHSVDLDSVNSALNLLDELCQYKENLKSLIEKGPQKLMKLGDDGTKCLVRFMSSTAGVKYLSELDFINGEIDKWHTKNNKQYALTIEEKIEMGLNAPKKNYSLTLTTPKAFQHSERIQIGWISKLPFCIGLYITGQGKVAELEVVIELEKEDVYMVGYIEEGDYIPGDGISVCLKLGMIYIDVKGNELMEASYIRCQKDMSNAFKNPNGSFAIESEGVVFSFNQDDEGVSKLHKVAYRIQLLPKGMPTMQVPHHLFGELAKTEIGIDKLKETKYLERYMRKLEEPLPIIEKRACLWALGHTGASNTGAVYLSKIGAIEAMVRLAEKSPVLSLRGTASQALSLVARSGVGRSELNKHQWISAQPHSASIAVPQNAESIFWIEHNEDTFPYRDRCREIDTILDDIILNDQEKNILRHVCILGSVISKAESEQFLRNTRNTLPMSFQSLPLFHAVMIVLGSYSFKLQTRRIIHKIFERVHRIECLDDLDTYRYIS